MVKISEYPITTSIWLLALLLAADMALVNYLPEFKEVRAQYKIYILVVYVSFAMFIMIELIRQFFVSIFTKTKIKSSNKKLVAKLDKLNELERLFVMHSVFKDQKSMKLPITNRMAISLEQKGLIKRQDGLIDILSCEFTFSEKVWSFLQDHREEWVPKDKLYDPEFIGKMGRFGDDIQKSWGAYC